MHAFSSSRSLIREISQSHGFAGRLWEYRLQKQWNTLVGEVVAAHTWPARIKFRKLHVAVDNSVWLHQLLYLKATLMENIQAQMEELQLEDIIFRIGELPEPREDAGDAPAEQAAVSPDVEKAARDYTRDVNDDELRDSLTKIIARALSSGQNQK
jgi:hypothetical protein